MAYSGTYKVKNPKKYSGDYKKVIYRSLWEKHCFKWADMNSKVKSWSSEEVVVPYLYSVDGRWHRYFVDMKVTLDDGKILLIEIKPFKETKKPEFPGRRTKRYLNESLTFVKNQNKWAAATKYANKRNWEFVIWTENELNSMGIMPKSRKPLKKMKSFAKKKK